MFTIDLSAYYGEVAESQVKEPRSYLKMTLKKKQDWCEASSCRLSLANLWKDEYQTTASRHKILQKSKEERIPERIQEEREKVLHMQLSYLGLTQLLRLASHS